MNFAYIVLLILLLLCGIGAFYFNRLVFLKNNRTQSFADIDVALKKRFDLIPNLVEVVRAYASHEKAVFDEVTKARSQAMSAENLKDVAHNQEKVQSSLKSLFAVAEAYPDLKANTNYLQLQQELTEIEDHLAASRRFFNHATKEYNAVVQSFPTLLIASPFGFSTEQFFDADESERNNVSISL